MEPRDRAVIINLTDEIRNLTKAIQPDSFHKRQVPALKRITKTLDLIRDKRELILNTTQPKMHKDAALQILDEVCEMLLST
jgi:hypothetical protein